MDGAAADDQAATPRDRSADIVRAFPARGGAAASSGFDPLSLFSAEPAGPAAAAAAAPPRAADASTRSRRRTPATSIWLVCGIAIGVAAGIAAPRLRLPLRAPAAASPRMVPVAIKPTPPAPAPAAIDTKKDEPAASAPVQPAARVQPTHVETAAVRSSAAPQVAAFGWMSIASPFDVEVFDGQTPIGGSGAKVMLSAGRHTVRFVNASLGYDESRAVSVGAGKTARVTIDAPKTTMDINAVPWADVSIDGVQIGQTPLGHVPVSIGSHVVQFRHPQFGEEQRTITVTSKGPNRVAVDFRTR